MINRRIQSLTGPDAHDGIRDARHAPWLRLAIAAAVLALPCLALSWTLAGRLGAGWEAASVATTLFVAGAALATVGMAAGYPHTRLGVANAVTLFRLALAAPLSVPLMAAGALVADPVAGWAVFGLALVALSLDGVDGWAARRANLASTFGARFDMEVDAVLAALLALLVWQTGAAGSWVLVLGFARYAFVAAAVGLPWLAAPLPESRARKAVCVLQIGTLILCLAPVVMPPVSTAAALVATAALVWSFGRDIRWLWRHAGRSVA
jgi:phosphatidylglycerophosphate synthase